MATASPAPPSSASPLGNPRSRKQFLLFAAGASFMILSSAITRRALRARRTAAIPKFYTTSPSVPHAHHTSPTGGQHPHSISPSSNTYTGGGGGGGTTSETQPVNGAIEALQALHLATLHTFSFAMTLVGGLSWALDISSLDELRRKVRGGFGVDGSGRSETDVEEEFEEWLASTLARKEDKEQRRRAQIDLPAEGTGAGKSIRVGRENTDEASAGFFWRNERGRQR